MVVPKKDNSETVAVQSRDDRQRPSLFAQNKNRQINLSGLLNSAREPQRTVIAEVDKG